MPNTLTSRFKVLLPYFGRLHTGLYVKYVYGEPHAVCKSSTGSQSRLFRPSSATSKANFPSKHGEHRSLVTHEPVEFEESPVKFKAS